MPKPEIEQSPSPDLRHFSYAHLPPHLQRVSKACHDLATLMESEIRDGPERAAGLRKLLEAKDCFVRAKIEAGFDKPKVTIRKPTRP